MTLQFRQRPARKLDTDCSTLRTWRTGKTWQHVTHGENVSQGRLAQSVAGERHGNARLTNQDVLEMRRQHALGTTVEALAARFRVKKRQVQRICARRAWKHI